MKKSKDETAQSVTTVPSYTTAVVRTDLPTSFRGIKKLTRDVASVTRLGEAIICCQSEIYTIQMADQFNPGVMRDVLCVDCLDCLRGDEYTLICGAVLGSTLSRVPDGVNGKYFAIRSGEIPDGKRYRKVEVVQLERIE